MVGGVYRVLYTGKNIGYKRGTGKGIGGCGRE